MASVTLQRLTKRFGQVQAVDGLDVAIEDGEFLTLLGPSGCGKSTALACIAGLERPTEGAVIFDQHNVIYLNPAAQKLMNASQSDFRQVSPRFDAARLVGANLDVMDRDARRMRGTRPFLFSNLKENKGVDDIAAFIVRQGGLPMRQGPARPEK